MLVLAMRKEGYVSDDEPCRHTRPPPRRRTQAFRRRARGSRRKAPRELATRLGVSRYQPFSEPADQRAEQAASSYTQNLASPGIVGSWYCRSGIKGLTTASMWSLHCYSANLTVEFAVHGQHALANKKRGAAETSSLSGYRTPGRGSRGQHSRQHIKSEPRRPRADRSPCSNDIYNKRTIRTAHRNSPVGPAPDARCDCEGALQVVRLNSDRRPK